MRIMNKDIEVLKERIIAWIDERGKLYDYFEPTSVKSRVVMSENEVETLRNYLLQG